MYNENNINCKRERVILKTQNKGRVIQSSVIVNQTIQWSEKLFVRIDCLYKFKTEDSIGGIHRGQLDDGTRRAAGRADPAIDVLCDDGGGW